MTSVGVVGLGEAGNLGDDLILLSTIRLLSDSAVDEIHHLSFGELLPWTRIAHTLGISSTIYPHSPHRDLPGSQARSRVFEGCDGVVFGGGGLLQSVHHPYRPFHWLNYLPTDQQIGCIAMGLGLGPLSPRWRRRLANRPMPFDTTVLRDRDSVRLAERELGWEVQLGRDFVTPDFLDKFLGHRQVETLNILGVAIRAWPGLDEQRLARHIREVAAETGANEVRFYVLEAKSGRGPDVEITTNLASAVGLPSEVVVYHPSRILEFLDDMRACQAAVSMKLHASVVWDWAGTSLYPIHYAPKTAALFGDEYQGLEVVPTPRRLAPIPAEAAEHVDVLSSWLASLGNRSHGSHSVQFTMYRPHPLERFLFQSASTAVDIGRRARRELGGREAPSAQQQS
ncbi:polysaccharide pyruvyl transferase family protein [Nocardioides sp. GCM10027113]|uniref:polysaccharide pyruvyl transferase family protein n=1 Tax=unclassified Nocardioides TaxID=2615069 RepID=UPI003608D149